MKLLLWNAKGRIRSAARRRFEAVLGRIAGVIDLREVTALASITTLVAIAAVTATTTHAGGAGVTCRFVIATHTLTVTFSVDDANGGIVRDGEDLVVEDVFGPIGCAGRERATRFNTELVRVRSRAASVDDLEFDLNLRGGPFAPGFSDEGDGSSEIEFRVAFPVGSASRVGIEAGGRPDRIVLGDLARGRGANLNAAEDEDDPDVRIGGAIPMVYGSGGADVISARGDGGFIGPYPRSVFAAGESGDDLLVGGPKRDFLYGRRGQDTIKGLGGGDFLIARDNARDLVKCGSGRDVARVDRIDRLRRCEDVRAEGRSHG